MRGVTRRDVGICAAALAMAALLPAPAPAAVFASDLVRPSDPVLGNPEGSVTIVDFYDLYCPPCRAMNARIRKLITADRFVRYVPVDYPVLGAASVLGAKALFAAALQGKYAALRKLLIAETEPPDMASLERDAHEVGLDWPRFELDLEGDRVAARIEKNLARGQKLGIRGIPVLFIGAERIEGEVSYAALRAAVAEVRKNAGGSVISGEEG